MVAGKCASRARRMSPVQRVRSALFFSVSVGTERCSSRGYWNSENRFSAYRRQCRSRPDEDVTPRSTCSTMAHRRARTTDRSRSSLDQRGVPAGMAFFRRILSPLPVYSAWPCPRSGRSGRAWRKNPELMRLRYWRGIAHAAQQGPQIRVPIREFGSLASIQTHQRGFPWIISSDPR